MSSHPLRSILASTLAVIAFGFTAYACGGGGSADQAGQPCTQASQCYPMIDPTTLKGTVQCLTAVPGGYCTHLCQTDADCCAVKGECPGNHAEVCSPFESTGMQMCFLSCEANVLGGLDETTFCQTYAGAAFGCRSTGGGANNRKICSP